MSNFIEFLKIVVFGLVEGFTEWLPISSTGHLILVENIVHLNASAEFMKVFRVVIQLGAIMAVVVLYFNRLNPWAPGKDRKISSLPPGICGSRSSSPAFRQLWWVSFWTRSWTHTCITLTWWPAMLIIYGDPFHCPGKA